MERGRQLGAILILLGAVIGAISDRIEEVRLVGGSGPCEGRVEVKIGGEWSTVCEDDWDEKNTEVVCRQMGCPRGSGHDARVSSFGAGTGTVWLTSVTCNGQEETLNHCKYCTESEDICHHKKDIGIVCAGGPQELRLVGGTNACEGRLEVRHQGVWGTVCGDYWNDKNAAVVCRQLGCSVPGARMRAVSFGPGEGKVWFSNAVCTGEESNLWQCQHQMWGHPFCDHEQDVGVMCAGEPEEIKLADGKNECEGRLMVRHEGQWGTVCGYFWGVNEATIVCIQLGCGGTHEDERQAKVASFGAGSGKVWLSHVKCSGAESAIWECNHPMWGIDRCGHKNDVGVICENKRRGLSRDFRLTNNSQRCSGRVEMMFAGKWGSLCHSHWNLQAANVLCRQLQCGTAVSIPDGGHFGENSLLWTDEFYCEGTESSLRECTKTTLGNSVCPEQATASVIYSGTMETLRLVGGVSHCHGRLEVLQDDNWGRVTDHQWDNKDAQVVCRQLHCGEAIDSFTLMGPAHEIIQWDSLICQGSEMDLKECLKTQPLSSAASTDLGRDVGVICSESQSVQLMNGPARCAGTVQIYHKGKWSMVSGDTWTSVNADVVCRELKCGHAINVTTMVMHGAGNIWLKGLRCAGHESKLWECPSSSWEMVDSGDKEAARLVCSEFIDLHLVGGGNRCEGRLEIYYNGSWGSVCNNVMTTQTASLICKQLRCGSGLLYQEGAPASDVNAAPSWLEFINCRNSDRSLGECPSSPWGRKMCDVKAHIQCTHEESD
ncbi:scavenger receptor cysteine-rich type 1 protein M130-like isoform X1 [Bufo bufo]|uniref:scavenger receptor cysteine-rich type 1 protein M130-like isoform X1 n=1 Tax=Bufo bufo TaxID=8384 RepID=UPI001ABE9EFC|nr:scavenger receptor cysteine-rich type 1 protein M130-like isoform X1 [Bufo bufo]